MDVKISDRMANINPSAIREMLKVTAMPNVISFAAGGPSPEEFPVKELAHLAAEIFETDSYTALQYSVTEGYAPLREITKDRIKNKFNIGREFDDLIIVSGGQQTISLATQCLVNEGDIVVCENPSFVGALNTFRAFNAKLTGVPMDENGMDITVLENILKTESRVKLIYTIPTFQNPTGVTMPLKRRQHLLELAEKYDVMILEDDPYYELRYSCEIVPTLKSMDETGRVIYSGSYSKTISPGMRIGYACGCKELIAKMTVAKQTQDVHTNAMFMMIVARYIEQFDFDAHIRECCEHYKVKRDFMLKKMEEKLTGYVKFTKPEGGLFIWCELPQEYSGFEFCKFAANYGVACVPGTTFDVAEDRNNNCFRLNFTIPSLEQIDKGIDIVADCLEKFIK
jgi:2-aminoadipate transaminase